MIEITRTRPPIRISRRVVLSVLGGLILICCFALPQYLRAKKSAGWPFTDGTITISWANPVRDSRGSNTGYYAEIGYRYRVDDTEYHGNVVSFERRQWTSRRVCQSVLDKYPVGKLVKVYYRPGDPSQAVLEPGLVGDLELLYNMDLLFIGGFVWALVAALLWYHDPEEDAERGRE